MNATQIITYILFGLVIVLAVFSITSYLQTRKAVVKLNAEDFKARMRKGQLIDVRTKKEFDAGHINGARNIYVNVIQREYTRLRKDLPVYIYCDNGKKSSRAGIYLKSKGYIELYALKNGLKGWSGPLK